MKKSKYIFLAIGIIILILLIKAFGAKKTLDDLIKIGPNFLIIVAIFFFNHIFLTIGWKVLITTKLTLKKFPKLLMARIAGDSTASINTLAATAGEALKAMFIKDIVPLKIGMASVVLDRTIHTLGSVLIVIVGIFIAFFKLQIPIVSLILTLIFFIAFFLLLVKIIKKQKQGFTTYIVNKLPSFIKRKILTENGKEKLKHLDEEIAFIFSSRDNLHHFYISLFLHTIPVLIAGSIEIFLILKFIDFDITLVNASLIYIFGLFITSVIIFMPGNIGIIEGSYSIALVLLFKDNPLYLDQLGKLGQLGVSVGIIRRFRTLVWSGIGMIFLFHAGLKKRSKI